MTLLLLAGTGEAKRIAWSLADSGRYVIASLAGATHEPEPLPVPTRVGGFGGAEAFATFLDDHEVTAVMDATHPFATRISARTSLICAQVGIPYCQIMRPQWEPEASDRWHMIDTPAQAAKLIGPDQTVFLATGRQTLQDYSDLAGRRVISRVIDPPTAPFPFEGGEFLVGRPPFTEAGDKSLFTALGVDWLVVKNAGGIGGMGKLRAARALGIPVVMLKRPEPTAGTVVTTVPDAVAWVNAL